MWQSANVGLARRLTAIRDGRKREPQRRDSGFEHHIVGAIGEYVVAKALDMCWTPAVGRLDGHVGDLRNGYQVRSTLHARGHLVIRKGIDDLAATYALVVLDLPHAHFVGTIEGNRAVEVGDFVRAGERGANRDGYWVKQSQLEPAG